MATSTKSRLTGERPQQGVTPDSLLALHEAGYRAVLERMGGGRILDVGCGQGFESARFLSPSRQVVGADYSIDAVATAAGRYGPEGLRVAQMDALRLGFAPGQLRRRLLLPPHRALHRSRAARVRAGPGPQGRRGALSC